VENIVIFCFERRFSKQNSVIRLISSILAPQIFWPLPNFRAGYATDECQLKRDKRKLRNEKNLINLTNSWISLGVWRMEVQKQIHVNSP